MTVFEIYIKTTPERLWEAITSEEMRAALQLRRRHGLGLDPGVGVQGRGAGGDRHRQRREPRGRPAAAAGPELHRALERRGQERRDLPGHLGDRAGRRLLPARVTHDQLGEDANSELYGGWPMILSGLKTLLETGEDLDTPGSLRYSGAAGA